MEYYFTGGNWKGKVSSSEILFTFHGAGIWQVSSDAAFSQNGNEFYRQWKNWEAELECKVFLTPMRNDELVSANGNKSKYQYHITNSGEVTNVDHDAYAIMRGDIVYGNLDKIGEAISPPLGKDNWVYASQDWDSEPGNVKFNIGRATMIFKPGSDAVKALLPVNDNGIVTMQEKNINLPGQVVLVKKKDSDEQLLYVPIDPVLKVLNGTYKLDREMRTISYSFTKEGLADFVTETVASVPPAVVAPAATSSPAAVPVNTVAKVPAESAKANALPMNILAGLGALLVALLAGYFLKRRKTAA